MGKLTQEEKETIREGLDRSVRSLIDDASTNYSKDIIPNIERLCENINGDRFKKL